MLNQATTSFRDKPGSPVGLALCLCSLLFFLSWAPGAEAVLVEDLYRSEAEVSSRSDERARQAGFTEAFSEVLVKVTGSESVLENAAVRRALSNPQSYVEFWEYNTLRRIGDQGEEEVILLEVTFFAPRILDLLDQNAIPVWPENRPVTLVWVVLQEGLGFRRLLSAGDDEEVLRLIQEEAGKRGLPLVLPLLDEQDQQMIDADRLWALDDASLRAASARYQTDSILVLRLFRDFDGEMVARSHYYFRDYEKSEESYQRDLQRVAALSVSLAADELSAYYAVLVSGISASTQVRMQVEGVDSVDAYAGLMRYVQGLVDVNRVDVVSVHEDRVDLMLSTGGQTRQLMESIALDRSLRPLGDATRDDTGILMHYQWAAQ